MNIISEIGIYEMFLAAVIAAIVIFCIAVSVGLFRINRNRRPRVVSAAEVEKYRAQFVTGPAPRREFIPPPPPSIACPKCGAPSGEWCATFAPFAQYATCVERRSADDGQQQAVASGHITDPRTIVSGSNTQPAGSGQ